MDKAYIKLGNTEFNIKEICKMKKADFIKQFTGQLDGYDVEDAYYTITGKKPPVKDGLS